MAKITWSSFAVGSPAKPGTGFIPPNCKPLATISHVAHLPLALRIVEDGAVRANLISDESRLKKKRISISWLSPNDWSGGGGFRYGNIRFRFNADDLLNGHRAYRVEIMDYGIPASRILITDVDRSDELEAYHPDKGGGPWWRKAPGEHYWNGDKHCLEFMFEGDVPLEKATAVDFVPHHLDYCSLRDPACKYRGTTDAEVGALFLATLASRQTDLGLPGLLDKNGRPEHGVRQAIDQIQYRCRRQKCTGDLSADGESAPAIARAVLGAFANDLASDLESLSRLFSDHLELQTAVLDVLAKALGVEDREAAGLLPRR